MEKFTGTWEITSSPDFDADYLRQSGPPYVRLRQQGGRVEGEYEFGPQHGHLDGRPDGEERIIFSFEGMEGEGLVNGAGIAILQQDRLLLTLMYHFGPDHILEGVKPATLPESASGDR